MDIYDRLNCMLDYIEKHLFEEISLSKLSSFVGINVTTFKNFFSLLTGQSITSYIKFRRLSECLDFLRENSVLEVAILCGYNSRASFSRAFKNFHGFNPSDYVNTQDFNYFARINFNNQYIQNLTIPAKYKTIKSFTLYGEMRECENFSTIYKFWGDIEKKYPIVSNKEETFGLVYKNRGSFNYKYYIALRERFSESNQIISIPSATYLSIIFDKKSIPLISDYSKSIKSMEMNKFPNIEIYKGDTVELLFKVNKFT